jgi:hypothetical protein
VGSGRSVYWDRKKILGQTGFLAATATLACKEQNERSRMEATKGQHKVLRTAHSTKVPNYSTFLQAFHRFHGPW